MSSLSAKTTHAPAESGTSVSRSAMSKEIVVTASSDLPGPRPSPPTMWSVKFCRARCGITTPFGLPVDPDV
ncbi:Uncharacterised protein [Mycobacteroides abscessus subsp. abscessus]|nr:Uncharacterised protein [Mycobacteroides abscessus subsp. abscessus]